MAVIPLTLTISLCLVATFVIFFLREQTHRKFHSVEHDALLPLADENRIRAARVGRTIVVPEGDRPQRSPCACPHSAGAAVPPVGGARGGCQKICLHRDVAAMSAEAVTPPL